MTLPPGDPWTPLQPSQPSQAAPALDRWGRPLLQVAAADSRVALARAAARLHLWLAVLAGVLVVFGLLWAVGLFLGGRAGVRALFDLSGTAVPGATDGLLWDGLLGLAALLLLVLSAVYVGVVLWARELLARLAAGALQAGRSTAPDAAHTDQPRTEQLRTEQLRRTLAGWLIFGQWGGVAGLVLSVTLVPLTLYGARLLLEHFSGQLGPEAARGLGQGLGSLGPAYEAVQMLSALISGLPAVVIAWLILGSVLRFMNLAAARARGEPTAPLTPVARTVSSWFLLCLILLGVQALSLLLAGAGGAVSFWVLRQNLALGLPAPWDTLLAWAGPLLLGTLAASALVLGVYFALLLFSRGYALSLAQLLDQSPGSPPTGPSATLPTGSAGRHPNTFRGQF